MRRRTGKDQYGNPMSYLDIWDEPFDRKAKELGVDLGHCPVCGNDPQAYEDSACPGERECIDHIFYLKTLLAGGLTPRQWGFDWTTAEPTSITEAVEAYLDGFDEWLEHGIGFTLLARYGAGKTLALARIVMHGLEQERACKLVTFEQIISAYQREDADKFEHDLKRLCLLAVDEIIAPVSEAQASLFHRFTSVIDARYEAGRPVLLAANLSAAEMEEHYPAVFSRLQEKSLFVDCPDIDFRRRRGLTKADRSLRLPPRIREAKSRREREPAPRRERQSVHERLEAIRAKTTRANTIEQAPITFAERARHVPPIVSEQERMTP